MTRTPLLHEAPDIHQRRWFLLGVMCLSLVMVVMSVSGLGAIMSSVPLNKAGAIGVARQIGGAEGAQLVERAGAAFTDAIGTALLVSALISVIAGAVVSVTGRPTAASERTPETVEA